jgi:hypothetical protein
MLYTSQQEQQEGGGRGKHYDPNKQRFEDAMFFFKKDALKYLTPFFKQAEEQLKDNKTNAVEKRVKLLKEKVVEIMRDKLTPEMGIYRAGIVDKVTLAQIRRLYDHSQRKAEQEKGKEEEGGAGPQATGSGRRQGEGGEEERAAEAGGCPTEGYRAGDQQQG